MHRFTAFPLAHKGIRASAMRHHRDMMIDPAVEAAHTDDEIAELSARLDWLRRYRAICVGGPVPVEVWERRAARLDSTS